MTQQITLVKNKILSDNYFILHDITCDLVRKDDEIIRHKREVYDHGSGATILLHNAKEKTVALIHQFHVATRVNGNESRQLIEARARLLDNDEPEVCIRKEAIEETGYEVGEVYKLFELYMSPSGVTELIHFFVVGYSDNQRANASGDIKNEDIRVLEPLSSQALEMVKTGEIRGGRTVLLLSYLQMSHLMD